MNVKVIDEKTGAERTMSKRHADILVRLKKVRYPDLNRGQYMTKDLVAEQPASAEIAIEVSAPQPEQKKRGRKPKSEQ
ncbi:hypothetical protein [Pseudomonas sp. p1(2021b)]|uniref:hypothetical protein n=1 Tax=Pseudomonas sp. p1(2021b) TaxID=2874628 RepID=UPI003D28746B